MTDTYEVLGWMRVREFNKNSNFFELLIYSFCAHINASALTYYPIHIMRNFEEFTYFACHASHNSIFLWWIIEQII